MSSPHRFLILACVILITWSFSQAGEMQKPEKCSGDTQECLNYMTKKLMNKGLIGIDGTICEKGYLIDAFLENSNAPQAGIQIGDRLLEINGISVLDRKASAKDAANRKPGSTVKVKLRRDGKVYSTEVVLVSFSEHELAQALGKHMLLHSDQYLASQR